jgi:hypothetical protein
VVHLKGARIIGRLPEEAVNKSLVTNEGYEIKWTSEYSNCLINKLFQIGLVFRGHLNTGQVFKRFDHFGRHFDSTSIQTASENQTGFQMISIK